MRRWYGNRKSDNINKRLFSELRTAERELEELYSKAAEFAYNIHKDQQGEDSTVYTDHIMRVAERVTDHKPAVHEQSIAAVLKDTVQDSITTYEQIKSEFGSYIADSVKTLTADKTAVLLI